MTRKPHFIGTVFMAVAVMLLASAARCWSQVPYPLVSLFQYEVFYNLNLEVDSGEREIFNGPIFGNASMWSGTTSATYAAPVEVVGSVSNGPNDPFVNYIGPGPSTFLPGAGPFSGVVPITPPPGFVSITNFESILQLPPSAYALGSSGAYSGAGLEYIANYADLIISNSASGMSSGHPAGTNFFVYYQDPFNPFGGDSNPNNLAQSILWMTNDYYVVTNVTKHTLVAGSTNYVPGASWTVNGTNYQIWYAGYSFLTNVLFYDWREGWNGGSGYGGKGKPIWAVQFDVAKFNLWQTNTAINGGGIFNGFCNWDKFHPIASVYIYNSVPLSTTNLPAVRVINGSKLPDSYGLSIATPQPLYVLGDFNVTEGGASDAGIQGDVADSWPASFLADAVTVLSSAWNDATTAQAPNSSAATTINAACLAGIVPSNPSVTSFNNANYSGGLENFFRLLENWGSLYYNGSIAVMFPSQYATNRWLQTGNYYGAPVRFWSFNTNFVNGVNLPPLAPYFINSNAAPSFAMQPQNAFVLVGQMTNFNVSASGVPALSYQWSFDGTNISGETNALLSLADIEVTNAGDYFVEVSNVLGSVISSNALLSVYTSAVPVLNALSFSSASGAEFVVSGVPGFDYTVEASSNLIDWVPVMTNDSPFVFSDTNGSLPQRFYRGVYGEAP